MSMQPEHKERRKLDTPTIILIVLVIGLILMFVISERDAIWSKINHNPKEDNLTTQEKIVGKQPIQPHIFEDREGSKV